MSVTESNVDKKLCDVQRYSTYTWRPTLFIWLYISFVGGYSTSVTLQLWRALVSQYYSHCEMGYKICQYDLFRHTPLIWCPTTLASLALVPTTGGWTSFHVISNRILSNTELFVLPRDRISSFHLLLIQSVYTHIYIRIYIHVCVCVCIDCNS